MKSAAAYVRVSDDRQEEFSPDSQIKKLREYAEKHNMYIPDELIFRDDGISGKRADKRPSFNEMIAIAKQKDKPFDTILVWKFSRFARNQEESIVYKSLLRKNGVDVISVSETLDDNPFSGLIERIIEWMDEYYLIRLSDEVRRGMTERATRGLPNTAPPFGYIMGNDGNYIVDEDNAPVVKEIFELFLNGWSFRKITMTMRDRGIVTRYGNLFELRTVEYILYNPTYAGYTRWCPTGRSSSARNFNNPDDIVKRGLHTPIIPEEIFEAAQLKLQELKNKSRKHERKSGVVNEYMLRGLVKCNTCGSTLVYSTPAKGLQCNHYNKGKCDVSHSINMKSINELVIVDLKKCLEEMTFETASNITPIPVSTTNVNYDSLISAQNVKLERAKQAYQSGVDSLDEYRTAKAKIEAEIKRLRSEQNASIPEEHRSAQVDFKKAIKNALKIIESPEVSETLKNSTLKEFIEYIVFYKPEKKVKIFFKG